MSAEFLNPARDVRGMAVTPHALAILRDGGNAVEATMAATASIAAVYPHMDSIGGAGFWLISLPGEESVGAEAWGAAASAATIDVYRVAVSFIQSVYHEFGGGPVLADSSIAWQYRSCSLSPDPSARNPLTPGRRPFHTLNPALARFADRRTMAYAKMHGDGQPQSQSAVFSRIAHFGWNRKPLSMRHADCWVAPGGAPVKRSSWRRAMNRGRPLRPHPFSIDDPRAFAIDGKNGARPSICRYVKPKRRESQ
jgi:gamma-glutamyltranspeptidase